VKRAIERGVILADPECGQPFEQLVAVGRRLLQQEQQARPYEVPGLPTIAPMFRRKTSKSSSAEATFRAM
jgi:hypothetical protein